MANEKIRLADMVQQLRKELLEATEVGEGLPLRFDLEEVELETQVVVTAATEGKGSLKFWVLNAELANRQNESCLQTITLRLKPRSAAGGTVRLRDRK